MTKSAEMDSRFRGNDGWGLAVAGMNQDVLGAIRGLLKEHEQIILTDDVFSDGGKTLRSGSVGTIVHVHQGGSKPSWWSSCRLTGMRWVLRLS